MAIRKFKSFTYFLGRVLDFYNRNGPAITISTIRQRLFHIQKKHLKLLLKKFPQKLQSVARLPLRSKKSKLAALDLIAQDTLHQLMTKLGIQVDALDLLALIRLSLGEDRYFHVLDDLFTYEQFLAISPKTTNYPVLQTSLLPTKNNTHKRRDILFITAHFPNPYHGGGGRVLNFIKGLSKDNNVYLSTCFIQAEDKDVFHLVEPYCRSIFKIPHFEYGDNRDQILSWLDGKKMDIVHYEWPRSLENFCRDFGKIHIYTYMEAVSLRLLMDIEFLEPLSLPWLEKVSDLVYALRVELADSSQLDARIAVTKKDAEFLRKLFPYQEYSVLNHGVTFDEFYLPDVEPEPNTLTFVGNFRHYPNADAMRYFFDEIWNEILREISGVRIYLVGSGFPKEIIRSIDSTNVIVTGRVPDIRPYIQKASVCIAPLITGAGMRGKVIDYAALNRPFVATSIATEDLVFKDGVDYFCADSPNEFSQKILTLLRNRHLAQIMAASAHRTARMNYDTYHLTSYLLCLYNHLEY